MDDKLNEDPLLKFFFSLLDNEEEKKILYMIFKEYNNEQILEKIINYAPNEVKNASV